MDSFGIPKSINLVYLVFHSMYLAAFAFTTWNVYFGRWTDPYRQTSDIIVGRFKWCRIP